jgi:hypothetical protein
MCFYTTRVKISHLVAGPFLRIFPWGGGAFFEKGPFCEIIGSFRFDYEYDYEYEI